MWQSREDSFCKALARVYVGGIRACIHACNQRADSGQAHRIEQDGSSGEGTSGASDNTLAVIGVRKIFWLKNV